MRSEDAPSAATSAHPTEVKTSTEAFISSVEARKNGKQIHVLFHYESYDCVGLFCDENYVYFASRMAEKCQAAFSIPSSKEWYYKEFKEFYGILSGGKQEISYEEFISPVFIINAILRSLESGKEEFVRSIKI